MEFSFKIKINAEKKKIWEYYSDIEKWYVWEKDLKNISLTGKFETGSEGIMELEGMPPIKYSLISVTKNKEFWDKTDTPLGEIYFGHEIFENGDNISIKHTVKLESDIVDEKRTEFLKEIFLDVPESMLLLKKVVENEK
ncbi:polyketide cyclase [Leptotrichia sp. OH3620_COT-345]|uniref:polyketide cyclase n=1 Tax=Leptotrichia sp. OH3620_COT-345 TaxID=2491048 RepID=UPI000F650FA1|nr:polyketide cyclase [Leptotrichia sp. OH3620_COT-345]RRD38765.1 polyketide cyclase [Leptotrichia sp. OH3620_COT-345]